MEQTNRINDVKIKMLEKKIEKCFEKLWNYKKVMFHFWEKQINLFIKRKINKIEREIWELFEQVSKEEKNNYLINKRK
jgi:isopropylmalate/homocitrate/citramalate synthase